MLGIRGRALAHHTGEIGCVAVGFECTSNAQCCHGTGQCVVSPYNGKSYCEGQPLGGPCVDLGDCGGDKCRTTCIDNVCTEVCVVEGQPCGACGAYCCEGLECVETGFTEGLGPIRTCFAAPTTTTPAPGGAVPPQAAEARAAGQARGAAAREERKP